MVGAVVIGGLAGVLAVGGMAVAHTGALPLLASADRAVAAPGTQLRYAPDLPLGDAFSEDLTAIDAVLDSIGTLEPSPEVLALAREALHELAGRKDEDVVAWASRIAGQAAKDA